MKTRKQQIGLKIGDELAKVTAPSETFINSDHKLLYSLEEARNATINAAAREWAKVNGLDPDDREVYWNRIIPQALFDTLESFSIHIAIVTAEAFLKQFGWMVVRPSAAKTSLPKLSSAVEQLVAIKDRFGDLDIVGGYMQDENALANIIVVNKEGMEIFPKDPNGVGEGDVEGVFFTS